MDSEEKKKKKVALNIMAKDIIINKDTWENKGMTQSQRFWPLYFRLKSNSLNRDQRIHFLYTHTKN